MLWWIKLLLQSHFHHKKISPDIFSLFFFQNCVFLIHFVSLVSIIIWILIFILIDLFSASTFKHKQLCHDNAKEWWANGDSGWTTNNLYEIWLSQQSIRMKPKKSACDMQTKILFLVPSRHSITLYQTTDKASSNSRSRYNIKKIRYSCCQIRHCSARYCDLVPTNAINRRYNKMQY